jgi:uncharacterized protein
MFVGIDLTAGPRLTAVAALEENLAINELALLGSNDELLEFARRSHASVVAIDAPLGLPRGMCCLDLECDCQSSVSSSGRECERALSRLGIGCYYTTKRSIIKAMVYRGMRLKAALEADGRTVLEVYPYASKVRLLGRPLPRKSSPEGRQYLAEALGRLLGTEVGSLDHDRADALFCAYTGALYSKGLTEALGNVDEGLLHLPACKAQ